METSQPPRRSFLKIVFVSPDEPRLRAGWRLLVQTILMSLLTVLAFTPIAFFPSPFSTTGLLISQIASGFAITLSVFLARRFLDQRSFASLGLKINRKALLDLAVGLIIPFFMMALIFIIEWGAGWLTLEGFAWERDAFPRLAGELTLVILFYIFTGWNEELLSRGYHLQNLESGLNTFWAVLLSSAVFGVMHLGNPNATWISAVGILLAGIFLAYGYLRTRQLWLPIGLHIGLNFFEGTFFGFPVSGFGLYQISLITIDGPELWTGGAFGPEAGLVLIPALLLGTALIYGYTRGRLTNEDTIEKRSLEN
jgi:membrane protease YdiL (CAAX protease family)